MTQVSSRSLQVSSRRRSEATMKAPDVRVAGETDPASQDPERK